MASILDYLGKALEVKKPDGTPIIPNPVNSTINIGSVSNITNLVAGGATNFLRNGQSSILPDTKTTAGSAVPNLPNVKPNPMEQFASVNVLWTLACLTPAQFNNPSSYRNSPADLKNIVFSSAGRFDEQRVKTFYGTPEYYVNNFQMKCIIGSTEKTGNSNAIKFEFDIYEPYSMGLLLQSMQVAAVNSGYANYLDNTPYLLKMDIQGFDELGVSIKAVKSKYFTLKLVSMKFSVNEGGSSYKVEGIPYNHQGFSDAMNTTFKDIKIFGKQNGVGNVVEVLSTGDKSLAAVLNDNEYRLKKEQQIKEQDEYHIEFPILASDLYSTAGNPPKTNRATVNPAMTEQQRMLAEQTADFEEADSKPVNPIGLASLGFDQTRGGNHIFKRAQDQYDPKTGVVKRDNMTIDPKLRAFHFSQDQTLTSIINQIVLSSNYASDAISKANLTPEGYIKWFKLDVQMKLLNYDDLIGDYAKKITYRVVPYFVHQSIFANPSAAPVGYAELQKSVCKHYQYIYTGQNVDILKFDININNLFFTGANPSPESKAATTANQDQQGPAERTNSSTKSGQGQDASAQAAPMGRARKKRDPKLLEGLKGGAGSKSTEQNVAENFQYAFLSGNSADLVTVDLEILGDPYWLVDSGMGGYFSGAPSETSQITNDGTMNYESGNVYVYLTFRTPSDVNETTGLYDFSIAGKESPFGGIYRVNMVENYFSDGFWKQKLKCLRMPGPQGPEINSVTGDTPGPISRTDNQATEISDAEPKDTSVVDDAASSSNSTTDTATANGNTGQSGQTTQTVTTSNKTKPVAGYRYYRDLGQQ